MSDNKDEALKEAFIGSGQIINSSFLNNLDIPEAKKEIISKIEKLKLGVPKNII